MDDIVARLQNPDLDLLWRDAVGEIEYLRTQNQTLKNALNDGDGSYDASQDEINELRKALVEIGHSAPTSNEELGFEYTRYAKRVIRHIAKRNL